MNKRVAIGLTVLALASGSANAAVSIGSPGATEIKAEPVALSSPQDRNALRSCQDGLRFGITVDKIPFECQASLVKTLGPKEKWEYLNGYLFFENGVLMAIREIKH
jgi:hypothetical protein